MRSEYRKVSHLLEAKLWFETYGEPEYRFGLKALRSADSSYVELEPLLDWDLAELQEDSIWTVVELPWEYENGFETIGTPEMKSELESVNQQRTSQVIRLVVMKNKITGDIYGCKMVVLPDLYYLNSNGDQLETNKYLSRDAELSGMVIFYSIDGVFVNGWQYANGEIIGIIEPSDMESTRSGSAGISRFRATWEYYTIETCYYYIVSTDGGLTWSQPRLSGCTQKTYQFLANNFDFDGGGGGGGGYYPAGGGGGGGSTNTSPGVDAPLAKEIFRNTTMTDANWEKIENMLEKIIEHCLGKGLYNGLKNALGGKTLTIEFNSGNSSAFSFDGTTAGIILSTQMESNHLFHEMLHAFQAYHETLESYKKSKLNREIEAWYAQYLYIQSLPEYKPGSKWHGIYIDTRLGEGILKIKDHVDQKGNLIQNETALYSHLAGVASLFREMPDYSATKYPYDYDWSAISNFSNLKRISANCN